MKFIQDASKEKLRGGFYTPEKIAEFILKWAVNGNKDYDVLEPSCGDGIFLEQIVKNNFKCKSLTAIEIDPDESEKAKKIKPKNSEIITGDFFKFCNSTNKKFNLVVGNPPYIRYQYFNKDQRKEAEKIFQKANLKYSKLTNAWVSFIVGSTLLLKENERGKIAFVVPAEILQVSYAKQLREFLARSYNKISIVSFKKLVFDKIQQEVVLLLCEKNPEEKAHLIEHLEVMNADGLSKLDVSKLKAPKKKIDFESSKWTFYFLEQEEINFLENLMHGKKIKPLRTFANVEVGITMGSNAFFTVPQEIVNNYNLKEYSKPLVGRSVQVTGCRFTKDDWKENVKSEARANFLQFPAIRSLKKNKLAMDYIKEGEKKGINKWYKTSIRDEWQRVPSAWISDAFFIRRNNIYPRLIINEAKAYTTDTMHRVSIKKDKKLFGEKSVNIKALIASYYNSLSFAFAELSGRSHGGGVLELMPNEAESILIPYHENNGKLLDKIDKMLREGKNIDDILKLTDKIILRKHYGFSDKEIKLLNSIWKKLQSRRLNRNKKD
jgi:adenine-specific DNA methylase